MKQTIENQKIRRRNILGYILAAVAILFGLTTIKAGGAVLFADATARDQAGNYVPFVLWSNFIGGFLYVAAGISILVRSITALRLSILIATLAVATFAALGVHIFLGGRYEMRTVLAMLFRTTVWVVIGIILLKNKPGVSK